MKKVISIIVALALMLCAVATVSAEVSPTATIDNKYVKVDSIVGSGEGTVTPPIIDPDRVNTAEGETVTLTAKPDDGYKFSHWEFISGEFEWVEGDLNSPVIIIRPTGDTNVRAEAHFVPVDQDVTTATTAPVHKPSPSPQSPVTGTPVAVYVVISSAAVVAIAALVILKKKQSA